MNTRIKNLKIWLNARSPREKIFIFAVGFAVIYFGFETLFSQPLARSEKQVVAEIRQGNIDLQVLQEQIKTILTAVNQTSYSQMLLANTQIQTQSKNIIQRLLNAKPNIVTVESYAKIVKDILSVQGNIALINIKRLPSESWIPKELAQADIPAYFKTINKYTLQIEFRSNFFNTIAYLQRIEQLPWHLYWDTLDYKVTKYPEANVIIKIHVLINPKGIA